MTQKGKTFVILFMLLSLTAFAAAEGGQAHGFDWTAFLGKVFNSTVLFGGLIYVLRKPLIRLLSDQSRDVRVDIEDRRKEIQAKTGDFDALKQRLDHLEAEVARVVEAARENGDEERLRIEESGRKESERIARITEEEVQNRVDAALRRLKSHVAEMAIDRFREDISGKLDADLHRRIIERNIEKSGEIIERK